MITADQALQGAEAMKRALDGLPKLVSACEDWIAELDRGRDNLSAEAEAVMQAGLGEHDEARVVEYIEGLQRCNAVVAGLARTARALAKTQRTQAKYLCLVLEGYVEPPVGFADGVEPIRVTPVAADELPPGPINGAAQQPQNVPPPVEPSGAPDEFPFQGGA